MFMNKKVLTLCAGFLLAGGMLSSVNAISLKEAAENPGKYYKMLRIGQKQSGQTQFQTNDENFSLEWLNDALYIDNDATNGIDYWKVSGTSTDGYILTNLAGKSITVQTQAVNENSVVGEEFTNLTKDEWYVIEWETGDTTPYALIPVTGTEYNSNTNYYSAAFDAKGTSLEEVSTVSVKPTKDNYYTIQTVNGFVDNNQYKAVDAGNGLLSFVVNTAEGNGDNLMLGGADKFLLVPAGDNQFVLQVGSQYISLAGTNSADAKVVNTIGEATIFAFNQITSTTRLDVEELTYYELDGFSLNITYDNDKAVAGNVFEGHLTPMVYNGFGFVNAPNRAEEFFLKNEAGEYIVATLYSNGSTVAEDVYTFDTVKEADLLHFLSFRNEDKTPAYYGVFTAESKDYKLNKKNLDVLDNFNVMLPTSKRTQIWGNEESPIGRYNIKGVWTLAVSANQTALEAVKVAVNAPALVKAKDLLKQKKFFTVTRKASTNKMLDLGPVAVAENGTTWDVVSSYGNILEGQWAITYDKESNEYTFTNRENQKVSFTLDGNKLYTTNTPNEYRYDKITDGILQYTITLEIAVVPEHKDNDGYDRLTNLKNQKFNIGYASGVYGNAWFTENHEGVNNHTIGLDTDEENALVFTATEYADAKKRVETPGHGYKYIPSDSIYVISQIDYIKADGNIGYDLDTLKVVSYSFVNQWGEPLIYAGIKDKYVSSVNKNVPAQKFALRYDSSSDSIYNLRPVSLTAKESYNAADWNAKDKMYNIFNNDKNGDLKKIYSGDAANGILDNTTLYDRTENDYFVVRSTDAAMYHRVVNNIDTVSIYRAKNANDVLFEAKGSILEAANIAQFEVNPAMFVDTAYVRYNTYRPQYMLVVDPDITPSGMWCEIHQSSTCEHAVPTQGWIEGRYLVNLKDTAIAWDKANKHSAANPYINSEKLYKLGFVQAKHIGDSLIIASSNDTLNVGTEDFNVAKFAFRYVDQEAKTFVIETANYTTLNTLVPGARLGEGYLKHMNGTIVVTPDMDDAEVFTMNEDYEGQPTANEEISANAAVSVVATDGAVIVKGAEGKNAVVSTILGKVVANEVLNSDNETIAAPAGIVVVSVDGESFKVAVK